MIGVKYLKKYNSVHPNLKNKYCPLVSIIIL